MPRLPAYLAVLASRRTVMAGRGRARRRPPPQLQPDAIRRSYFAELRKVIGRARELVRQHVVPELRRLVVQAAAEHADTAARLDESTGEVNRLIDQVADDWFAEFPNERLARLAEKFGQRTADFQRQQLSKQFQATLGIDVVQAEPWLGRRVGAFAGENVALIKSVAQRHFADLETKLVAGLRSGERWEDLAQMLQARYGVAESSAKLVARDQVGKLYGDLNRVRQQKLGVTSFVWRTMSDNRVRDEHELLDGETFSWDNLPDEGAPGEAINCFPAETLLSPASRVLKAYRRWYSGELTTLVTDSGEAVSATPNHPVLTRRGWVPIQGVDVGEDVFQASTQGGHLTVGDPEHVQATAEEFFRALAPLGVSKRVAGTDAWFHGDGAHQEVDVVDVDWGLCDELDPALTQGLCEELLALADQADLPLGPLAQLFDAALLASDRSVRGGCKALSLLLGGGSHPDEHGLAPVAWLESITHKLGANGRAGGAEVLRHLLHAPPLGVEPLHHVARVILGIVGRAVDSAPGLDPSLPELLAEVVGVHAQLAGGLGDGHPLVQKPLRVAKKLVREYSGHVFNLQTAGGWYVAQNLLVHNCRCFADPVVDEGAAEETAGPAEEPAAAEPPPELPGLEAQPPGAGAPPAGGGEPPGGPPPGGGGAGGGEGPPRGGRPEYFGGKPPPDLGLPHWTMETAAPVPLIDAGGLKSIDTNTRRVAERLASEGNRVHILPSSKVQHERRHDVALNPPGGDPTKNRTELTTINKQGVGHSTLKDRIEAKHRRRQGADQLVVDVSLSGMSRADAEKGVARAWPNIKGAFTYVRIMGRGFDLTFWKPMRSI